MTIFRKCPSCNGSGLIPVDWQNIRCYDLKDCALCGREGMLADLEAERFIIARAHLATYVIPAQPQPVAMSAHINARGVLCPGPAPLTA